MSKNNPMSDFSVDDRARLRGMLWGTWNTIGMDVLRGSADLEDLDIDRVSMTRSQVIEVVLDADHLEAYGPGYRDEIGMSLIRRYRQLSYEDQITIAEEVFTAGHYGT